MEGGYILQIGYGNPRVYKGRYSGNGYITQLFRQLLPLLKTYSIGKVKDFSQHLGAELGESPNLRTALKNSAKKTGQQVLKDIIGGKKRKRRVNKNTVTKSKKTAAKRKKITKRSKLDFFSNLDS